MSAQALSNDEKAHLQRHYVNEGGELPSQVDFEGTHLRRRHRRRRFLHFAGLSLLVFVAVHKWSRIGIVSPTPNAIHDENGLHAYALNWSAIEPSEEFEWHKCYDNFECARLSVPLDYSNPDGAKAAVAVSKLAANVSSGSKYGGPVLINPGGPGGSGVAVVLGLGKQIQSIIGEQFDIIGFDPRGVGLTTPTFYAFPDKNEAGLFYIDFPMNTNTSVDALGKAYAYSDIMGSQIAYSSRNVTEYVSTPLVARDMFSISMAMGYEKLQYWGFSYGTVLGATFSAMFPDNVGRVVIDGVVDSENYYAGESSCLWSNNLIDTDAALLDICKACVKAGPEKCGLHEDSAELVLERINKLLDGLKSQPIPVVKKSSEHDMTPEYGLVNYETVKSVIFGVLYNTHTAGAFLFNMLAELEKGNALPWFQMSPARAFRSLLACDCPAPGHELPQFYGLFEHTLAIACGDTPLENESLEDVQKVYDDIAKISTFADVWGMHVRCSGWKVKGKERFQGNFKHNTSHPLLLIGNTAANKMSKDFEGSVVLTQNTSGHCSISGTSLCTHKAIRAYFQNGTLPEKGTICEAESQIFGSNNLLDEVDTSIMSTEDIKLLEAAYTLQQNYFVPTHVLPHSNLVRK
ncbi:hypothetical protein SCHPADRAFT_916291 [Schizopora paradoxa]|uniref:Alpha/beta-hydrolase n=1 Tax=Schizopora paradoxa TaxID=27342 RepID=A0A0H2RGD6_9AGAM|nr:hypothetical protein SCHPADRAFT_916291 [Schizopora paradoxa]